MQNIMTQYWWTVALRGVVAILFGLAAFLWSGLTLQVLIALFGVFVLLDGLFTIAIAFNTRKVYTRWWGFLLQGIVGVAVGIIAFAWPAVTATAMLYMIAFWAIAIGSLELMAGIGICRDVDGGWLLGSGGFLTILLGVALLVWPGAALLSMIWLIGAYAIFFGVVLIAFGFKLRKTGGTLNQASYGFR